MPTGDESILCADKLLPGCADRRWFDLRSSQMSWMCRQATSASDVRISWRLDVPIGNERLRCTDELEAGCADRQWEHLMCG